MPMSFDAAAIFFEEKAAELEAARTELAKVGADVVQQEIQNELGSLQGAAGPYPAWPDLATHTQEERARMGFPSDDPLVLRGELKKSIQSMELDDGTVSVGTSVPYAKYLENGTSKMPPRPFIGRAAFVKQDEIEEAQAMAVVKILES